MSVQRVTRTTIDNVVWTPIVAPVAGMKVALYSNGGSDMLLRVDDADSGTEKTLPAGSQESIQASRFFGANETVWYAKSTVASDVVVATWIYQQR